MLNDSFSEYSTNSKDGSSSSKVCMEDDHEASGTISEVKSTSSMGTSVHLGTVRYARLRLRWNQCQSVVFACVGAGGKHEDEIHGGVEWTLCTYFSPLSRDVGFIHLHFLQVWY